MPNLFQTFLNQISSGYKKADKTLGGWLPGGGTASPVTRSVQPVTSSFKLANVRDAVLIPVLDKGLGAGVLPPSAGMYARFLSGTSKPLTELPPALQAEIPVAYQKAISPKAVLNPAWQTQFQNEYEQQLKLTNNPILAKNFATLNTQKTGVPKFVQAAQIPNKKGDIGIYPEDYISEDSSALTYSLGRFWINPETKQVKDRYDFNYYMSPVPAPSMQNPIQGMQMLLEGNPRGAIPFADALGLIKPGAGYEIKAPLK